MTSEYHLSHYIHTETTEEPEQEYEKIPSPYDDKIEEESTIPFGLDDLPSEIDPSIREAMQEYQNKIEKTEITEKQNEKHLLQAVLKKNTITSPPASTNDTSSLPICKYHPNCTRKNPDHFKEYSHPSVKLTTTPQATVLTTPPIVTANEKKRELEDSELNATVLKKKKTDLPFCPHGYKCTIKTPQHFLDFQHIDLS